MDSLAVRSSSWRARIGVLDGALRMVAVQVLLVSIVAEFVVRFVALPMPWTAIAVGIWIGVGNGMYFNRWRASRAAGQKRSNPLHT